MQLRCCVLQRVAACCSMLQCVTVVLLCAAACCSVLQYAAVCHSCVAVWCSVLQCAPVCCSMLTCVAGCCGVCCSLLHLHSTSALQNQGLKQCEDQGMGIAARGNLLLYTLQCSVAVFCCSVLLQRAVAVCCTFVLLPPCRIQSVDTVRILQWLQCDAVCSCSVLLPCTVAVC